MICASTPKSPRVLIVDDDRTIRQALALALEEAGYDSLAAGGVEDARNQLAHGDFNAVLLDIHLKDGDGLRFLDDLRRDAPRLPVIMATAYGDSEHTIYAMKAGAFEYVTKPFDLDALLASVARATRIPPAIHLDTQEEPRTVVGSSPAMLEVWKTIGRVAESCIPVLITGETGVGKEMVARAIHAHSHRRDAPFVAVNIAALPPLLVESELFGHEKGAFTGATARREGRFEMASKGTLFLDEIGDLHASLQTKLLRVLEDGGYERLGGTARLVSKARIVAATARPVMPAHAGATLREDLYYRLGVVKIHVPALRERRQDIPLLVESFLRRMPGSRRVSESAMQCFHEYGWPGNVRQLLHVLQTACLMSSAEVLDREDFALDHEPAEVTEDSVGDDDLDLRKNLERVERELIRRALRIAAGNRARAARLLGIRRALLYARMSHLQIDEKRA
jgi:DNA-binding NtrC family response regulator